MTNLSNKQLSIICDYIYSMDQNSNSHDLIIELINGDITKDFVISVLTSIIKGWKDEILLNGITTKEKTIFSWLKIGGFNNE